MLSMETTGDGMKKMFSKAFSGESMFQNIYTAQSDGRIAFGSRFPGKILPIAVKPGQEFIAQKMAFLASEMSGDLAIHFLAAKALLCSASPATVWRSWNATARLCATIWQLVSPW